MSLTETKNLTEDNSPCFWLLFWDRFHYISMKMNSTPLLRSILCDTTLQIPWKDPPHTHTHTQDPSLLLEHFSSFSRSGVSMGKEDNISVAYPNWKITLMKHHTPFKTNFSGTTPFTSVWVKQIPDQEPFLRPPLLDWFIFFYWKCSFSNSFIKHPTS